MRYLLRSEGRALQDIGHGLGMRPPSGSAGQQRPSGKEKNMAETALLKNTTSLHPLHPTSKCNSFQVKAKVTQMSTGQC